MNTIGVVGSRRRDTWADYLLTEKAVTTIYEKGDSFVSGGCPKGGDRFCEIIARKLGATITIHHADWRGVGPRAGYSRNTQIARHADVLIAVVASDRTGGTEDTITKFRKFRPEGLVILT